LLIQAFSLSLMLAGRLFLGITTNQAVFGNDLRCDARDYSDQGI